MQNRSSKPLPDPWDPRCPSRALLSLIADKWTLLLFPQLATGPRRTAELKRALGGISQKVLTDTLRGLEEHGLLLREDFGTVPPHVEYRLTPLGQSLGKTIGVVDRWVVGNFYAVAAARAKFQKSRGRRNWQRARPVQPEMAK